MLDAILHAQHDTAQSADVKVGLVKQGGAGQDDMRTGLLNSAKNGDTPGSESQSPCTLLRQGSAASLHHPRRRHD